MRHPGLFVSLVLAGCATAAPRGEAPPPSGVSLAYSTVGPEDGDVVIFLHGYTDTRRSWAATVDALAARAPGLRIYNLDLRGHGASPLPATGTCRAAPERCFQLRDLAADVVAFMDARGVQRAHLVGHSLGSFVAQELALAYPARVRSVTLVASAASGVDNPVIRDLVLGDTVEGRWRAALLARGLRWPDDAYLRTPLDADPDAERWAVESWVTEPGADAALLAAISRDTARTRLGTWIGVARMALALDLRPRLAARSVPALAISATNDEIFPPADRAALRAALEAGRAPVVWRELDAGHNLPWSQAAAIAAEIDAFIGEAGIRS